jgi:hypothetical protein
MPPRLFRKSPQHTSERLWRLCRKLALLMDPASHEMLGKAPEAACHLCCGPTSRVRALNHSRCGDNFSRRRFLKGIELGRAPKHGTCRYNDNWGVGSPLWKPSDIKGHLFIPYPRINCSSYPTTTRPSPPTRPRKYADARSTRSGHFPSPPLLPSPSFRQTPSRSTTLTNLISGCSQT